jgi:tetratricopeptide (TPR) repeat protein
MKRGTDLLAKKDYSRAILEFSNASRAVPADAEPYYQIGLANLELKRYPQAYSALKRAVDLNPKHIGAQLKLSALLVETRDPALVGDAEQRMTKLLEASPGEPEALTTLAVAEMRLGKIEDAEQNLERALKDFPTNLRSSAALAALKIGKHDLEGAEQVLKEAVRQAPKSPEAGLALAHFYLMTRRPADAEAELRRILGMAPDYIPALATLGALQETRGQQGEAGQFYARMAASKDSRYSFAHAAWLLRQKKYDPAIAELRKLAESAPADRAARTRLLAAELAAGRVGDAQKILDAAIRKSEKDTDALLQRSRILIQTGHYDEAAKDLGTVLRYTPDSAEAHYTLSRVFLANGSGARRRDELGEALRLRPDLIAVRVELAHALISAGAAKTALDIIDAAGESQRAQPRAVLIRNWALLALARYDEAAADIAKAMRNGPAPELVLQRAVLHLLKKDYAAAAEDADSLLAANPANPRVLQIAVQAELMRRRPADAEKRVLRAAAAAPGSAELQATAGQWFSATGKYREARSYFEAAAAAQKGYMPAEVALARLDQKDGKLEAARSRMQAAIAANPRDPQPALTLADLEYQAGNRTAARDRYRAVFELDHRNVVALNNYAYLLAESNPDEALRYGQQALELAPDSAMVLDTLGWIYYRKGMYQAALDHLEKAMARQPTPRRQFHLGLCQMKIGRQAAGAGNLKAALAKDPKLTDTETGW